jgi:hypothetical protein
MPTHDERRKAERYLSKAEECLRTSISTLIVAGGLAVPAIFLREWSLGWAGASMVGMAILMWGISELYIRAANRILNLQYRR